ncbi:MAG: PLP-dependent transferase [Oscillospiraceae bacterium]|nr:PLP-dependent transferase [Oscillospiraceae bacterium]
MSRSIETLCVHGDSHKFHDGMDSLSMPIYQTAAFGHPDLGHSPDRFYYTRLSNPTRTHLEETVSSLEGAAGTVAFSSGMAAITAVFELFQPGDRIVCSEDLYGGTVLLFDSIEKKNGLELALVDTAQPALVEAAMTPETKAIYIETPSNPMMNVTDIAACAAIAKKYGALLIVDNTFLSPYLQNPIALGADIVVHSGTKYLGGHNDTISGFVCLADKDRCERLQKIAYTLGATLSPFDSWLMIRGIKTLPIRMERAQENALAIALWLKEQPQVRKVYYVGLPEHPGYAVNAKQSRGAGGMLSFTVDSSETALRILDKVKLITFAESLGGPETLITFPATQTHADVSPEDREKLGITDSFLRMSIGLENAQDLITDLKQAMEP